MADARLRPGAHWLELDTGRRIRIIHPFVNGIGPSWTYVDSEGERVPDSERYPTWYDHHCDLFDFTVWGRFVCEDDMRVLGTAPRHIASGETLRSALAALKSYTRLLDACMVALGACLENYPNGWRPFTREQFRDADEESDETLLDLLEEAGYVVGFGDAFVVTEKLVGELIGKGIIKPPR